MQYTVKFRLSDQDKEDLQFIAGPEVSETLRRLIRDEAKRMRRREK